MPDTVASANLVVETAALPEIPNVPTGFVQSPPRVLAFERLNVSPNGSEVTPGTDVATTEVLLSVVGGLTPSLTSILKVVVTVFPGATWFSVGRKTSWR